jgi:hypothetical protein
VLTTLPLFAQYFTGNVSLLASLYIAWHCARAWNRHHLYIYQPAHVFFIFLGGISFLAVVIWPTAALYVTLLSLALFFSALHIEKTLGKLPSTPVDKEHRRYQKWWIIISSTCLLATYFTASWAILSSGKRADQDQRDILTSSKATVIAYSKTMSSSLQDIAKDARVADLAAAPSSQPQLASYLAQVATGHGFTSITLTTTGNQVVARSAHPEIHGDIFAAQPDLIHYDDYDQPVMSVSTPLGQGYVLMGERYIDESFLKQILSKDSDAIALADERGIVTFTTRSADLQQLLFSQEYADTYAQRTASPLPNYHVRYHSKVYSIRLLELIKSSNHTFYLVSTQAMPTVFPSPLHR